MHKILDTVQSPDDLKGMSMEQLSELCKEIRDYILECCSQNPGHLASSLGAVEIITAVHHIYNTPEDKFILDVGHQAYAHKILTGRKEAFASIRKAGELSGFPNMAESEYDAFGVGHSSTAISAALGMAEAARIKGENRQIIALVGDGALTGGLSLEGLNNAGDSKANLLVILNDNDHSIDDIHGGLRNHLIKITTDARYNSLKEKIWNGLGDRPLRRSIQMATRRMKSALVRRSGGDLFEAFGFRYFGPVDGNDIIAVVDALKKMKSIKGPKLLHCVTTKGCGYAPAVEDPTTWHAPGKFNVETGERTHVEYEHDRYQDVFGATLCELAELDERVVGITPAMSSGCGMNEFAQRFPNRFFDVGIEEEHAVTFSAGLAASGMRPVCNIYSSFSQRAYDQIIHDVALQGLPVIFCFDRAGLVGEDGATHQGVFDIAAYRSIPGLTICAPKDELELRNLMHTALKSNLPYIIRYPRGIGEGARWKESDVEALHEGKAECISEASSEGINIAVITNGPSCYIAKKALLGYEDSVGLYNYRYIKPFDYQTLSHICNKYDVIVTVEDGCLKGGLFSEVCEYVSGLEKKVIVRGVGVPDEFIKHARQSEQRAYCGINSENLRKIFKNYLENKK